MSPSPGHAGIKFHGTVWIGRQSLNQEDKALPQLYTLSFMTLGKSLPLPGPHFPNL